MIEPSLNQYAPPVAEVADVPLSAQTADLNFFSARGRIGRLRYLAWAMGASLIHSVVTVLLTLALSSSTVVLGIAVLITYLPLLWFSIITGIKRCHDINISGWWTLTIIVPIIALVWLFAPGSEGENRFGPPPPPNTTGVKILAWLFPFFAVLGILAAIAIPAYQAYTVKAQAAQAAPGN